MRHAEPRCRARAGNERHATVPDAATRPRKRRRPRLGPRPPPPRRHPGLSPDSAAARTRTALHPGCDPGMAGPRAPLAVRALGCAQSSRRRKGSLDSAGLIRIRTSTHQTPFCVATTGSRSSSLTSGRCRRAWKPAAAHPRARRCPPAARPGGRPAAARRSPRGSSPRHRRRSAGSGGPPYHQAPRWPRRRTRRPPAARIRALAPRRCAPRRRQPA